MGLGAAAEAEARATLEAVKAEATADRRAEICACGHPMGKHGELAGTTTCAANASTCKCRDATPVLRAPNARAFSFKTSETGHALMKGIGKALELGHGDKVDWTRGCAECEQTPVTIVELDGGRRNEPRCAEHR